MADGGEERHDAKARLHEYSFTGKLEVVPNPNKFRAEKRRGAVTDVTWWRAAGAVGLNEREANSLYR